jgi:sulfatase-like protein
VTALARVAFLFSVATLAFASPVYLRLADTPGVSSFLWLAVQVQVLTTAALAAADLWLERASPRAWRGWRVVLCVVCLVAVLRQVQISFHVPAPSGAWTGGALTAGILVGAGWLARSGVAMLTTFLTACAPALLVWTVLMAQVSLPAPARAVPAARVSARPLAVFVLLFDELDRDVIMRDGRVDAAWPNFARLAARARVFADSTSNYAHTCASVGSMLTGRLFEQTPAANRHCLQSLPGLAHDNLLSAVATRLRVRLYTQYLTYCFEAAFRCRGTADIQARAPIRPLLEHYVPDELRAAIGVDRVLGPSLHTYTRPVFERFLGDIHAADARGTLSWLHLVLPHSPYVYDAAGRIHRREHGEPGTWRDATDYADALRAYRRQVGFVDTLVGRFLDRLEAEGLADDAVVIVTSDHGFHSLRSFAAPELIDGFEVNAARPRAPMIVRAPGLAPGPTADDYQHVDFRGLVLRLIGGGDPSPRRAETRPKLFCDDDIWYVRDGGTWRPQLGPDGRPRGCRPPP